jgi:hypothetical protein
MDLFERGYLKRNSPDLAAAENSRFLPAIVPPHGRSSGEAGGCASGPIGIFYGFVNSMNFQPNTLVLIDKGHGFPIQESSSQGGF